jgi:glycosyltransferase involved in cell wall biosynthesis
MNDFVALITVKPVRAPDQLWNTLLSRAVAVILLPNTEGFDESFLGALQKGKPIITTEKLGSYLHFLENERIVFTVEPADTKSMAENLFKIWVDKLKQQIPPFLPNETWDEVTTVGNALNWLFLASELSKGENIEPNGESIYHLAHRDTAKETPA